MTDLRMFYWSYDDGPYHYHEIVFANSEEEAWAMLREGLIKKHGKSYAESQLRDMIENTRWTMCAYLIGPGLIEPVPA